MAKFANSLNTVKNFKQALGTMLAGTHHPVTISPEGLSDGTVFYQAPINTTSRFSAPLSSVKEALKGLDGKSELSFTVKTLGQSTLVTVEAGGLSASLDCVSRHAPSMDLNDGPGLVSDFQKNIGRHLDNGQGMKPHLTPKEWQALASVVTHDSGRPTLTGPTLRGGFAWASDGHRLVRADLDSTAGEHADVTLAGSTEYHKLFKKLFKKDAADEAVVYSADGLSPLLNYGPVWVKFEHGVKGPDFAHIVRAKDDGKMFIDADDAQAIAKHCRAIAKMAHSGVAAINLKADANFIIAYPDAKNPAFNSLTAKLSSPKKGFDFEATFNAIYLAEALELFKGHSVVLGHDKDNELTPLHITSPENVRLLTVIMPIRRGK